MQAKPSTQTKKDDERMKAVSVASANAMSIVNEEGTNVGTGLYLIGSLLNHSCSPNCIVAFEGVHPFAIALLGSRPLART